MSVDDLAVALRSVENRFDTLRPPPIEAVENARKKVRDSTNADIDRADGNIPEGVAVTGETRISRAAMKAYRSFEAVQQKSERVLTDREAYDLLKVKGIPDDVSDLADYRLPSFDTWARQLREARLALGERNTLPARDALTARALSVQMNFDGSGRRD